MSNLTPAPNNHHSAGIANIDINEQISRSITVTTNLDMNIVVTTRDKISNALHEMLPKFTRRTAWVAPAGLSLTLVTTLLSASFKDPLFGVDAAVWNAIFLLGAFASGVWLVTSLVMLICRSASHHDVLESIAKTHDPGDSETLVGVVTESELE